MTENKNILVIGLGSMGYGIAKSLMRSGYKVFGQDKNIDQQQKFIQDGGLEGEVLYDQLEAVIIVVLNEQQTGEIIFGEDGIANKLKNNTLVMVCTTVSPDFAKEMDNLDPNVRKIVDDVIDYMEKKYISVPMKMAKEILLKESVK